MNRYDQFVKRIKLKDSAGTVITPDNCYDVCIKIGGAEKTYRKGELTFDVLHSYYEFPLTQDMTSNMGASVVESYSSGSLWYRKWSDGWIEQGGYKGQGAAGTRTINFLTEFSNTSYCMSADMRYNSTNWTGANYLVSKTASSFNFYVYSSAACSIEFYACGY